MSTYVMSDLHGCKEEFEQMLTQIRFSEYDELYIIGDICDRGKQPIPLLQMIMEHQNMHVIMGNHDVWLQRYIPALIEAKKTPFALQQNNDFLIWVHYNGGFQTIDQFLDLDFPICYDMQVYFDAIPYYKEIRVGSETFLLVHAGYGSYNTPGTNIATVPKEELVWPHIGIDDNPNPDKTLIVGHLPTFHYGKEHEGKMIIRKESKTIHIDCGCVYGRSLGCLRLNDMQEFYVPSTYPYLMLG